MFYLLRLMLKSAFSFTKLTTRVKSQAKIGLANGGWPGILGQQLQKSVKYCSVGFEMIYRRQKDTEHPVLIQRDRTGLYKVATFPCPLI